MHIQSAQRDEANAGDMLAAILQQPKSHAAQLLATRASRGWTSSNYISHGISKMPPGAPRRPRAGARIAAEDEPGERRPGATR